MFKHAIRHPSKKALTDIRNHSDLSPLTLAAKLGRKDIFIECLELSHVVKCFIQFQYGEYSECYFRYHIHI
jgi:hypothetical protein